MRRLTAALIAALLATTAIAFEAAAEDKCMISDAALCLANPNCHWDVDKRGCEPGQAAYRDACAAHGDQAICDSDTTLGCKWSAEKNQCESKTE
jgi:hypothetical protein